MEMKQGAERKYISDEIGDEYMSWRPGNVIFIKAPTGSGKSHFILHTFLPWMIGKKQKMLYLVNRMVLKNQLQKELEQEVTSEIYEQYRNSMFDINQYSLIITYQSLEEMLKGIGKFNAINFLNSFDCVVCDEAHYFCSDSNFNTNTELSFDYIGNVFEDKIRIYISATLGKIEKVIRKQIPVPSRPSYFPDYRALNYSINQEYRNIDLQIFEGKEDLQSIITNQLVEKEKWLVFVDSIQLGEELQKRLVSKRRIKHKEENDAADCKLTKEDIVFIDTDYQKREDSYDTALEIIEKKCFKKKVVIATAVLDNGISIQDMELRNIVIFADTEEAFIQMLGRKRKGAEQIKLYICNRDIGHFKKRLRNVEAILNCHRKYVGKLKEMKVVHDSELELCTNLCYSALKKEIFQDEIMKLRYKIWNESGWIMGPQQEILDVLLSDNMDSQYLKKFCYAEGGIITVSELSLVQLQELRLFYKGIIQELAEDENAFIKLQASWIGMPDDEIEYVIKESEEERYSRYQKELEAKVEEVLDKSMSEEENKAWKVEATEQLLYFLKKSEGYTEQKKKDLKKKSRPISKKTFNRCMEAADLPYEMVKPKRDEFKIERKEEGK